jgi:hypothetical protein
MNSPAEYEVEQLSIKDLYALANNLRLREPKPSSFNNSNRLAIASMLRHPPQIAVFLQFSSTYGILRQLKARPQRISCPETPQNETTIHNQRLKIKTCEIMLKFIGILKNGYCDAWKNLKQRELKEIAFQAVMAFSCSTLSVPFRPIRSCFSPLNANA